MLRMRRRGGDLRVCPCRGQALARQHRVVVTMDKVVRYARVVWLLLEDRLEDLPAFPLVRKSLVGLGRSDIQSESMKDGCFAILGICGMHARHGLLESLFIRWLVSAVWFEDVVERVSVGFFTRRCSVI